MKATNDRPPGLIFHSALSLLPAECHNAARHFPEVPKPAADADLAQRDLERLAHSLDVIRSTLWAVADSMDGRLHGGRQQWSVPLHVLASDLWHKARLLMIAPDLPCERNRETVDAIQQAIPQFERCLRELHAVMELDRGPDVNGFGTGASSEAPSPTATDTVWEVVQGRLLAKYERDEPYTSLRKLAEELGCSDATIGKAIRASPRLTGWQARHHGSKAAPRAIGLDTVGQTLRQARESSPEDTMSDEQVDATMARLIDQAPPEARADLNARGPSELRKLAEAAHDQLLDAEPSPLELDAPGKRPRKVKTHKRA